MKTDKAYIAGLIVMLLWLAYCPALLAEGLYWCPVCGGDTHHEDGHPHFNGGRTDPNPPRPPKTPPTTTPQDNRVRDGLRRVAALVKELNATNDSDPRELELLTQTKTVLKSLLAINPHLAESAKQLKDIDNRIGRWHRDRSAAARQRALADERARRIRVLKTSLNDAVNRAERAYMTHGNKVRPTVPLSTSVVDARPNVEPQRAAIGIVTGIRGEVWATMATGPYIDSSVVDLRDAGTLTVDPDRVRGSTPRKRRLADLRKELRTLPPEGVLDIFLPESAEYQRLELARLKAEMMRLPPDDQMGLIFPAHSDVTRVESGWSGPLEDIPDLEPGALESVARSIAVEEADQAFVEAFRRMIRQEATADQLDESFKEQFRKELHRQWDRIGGNPASAALPRKLGTRSRLRPNDRIALGSGAHVQIALKDGSVLELSERCDFRLERASRKPDTGTADVMGTLKHGLMRFVSNVHAKAKRASRRIKVRNGFSGVRGTDFTLRQDRSGALEIRVATGEVEYASTQNKYESVTVSAGEFLKVSERGKPGRTKPLSNTAWPPALQTLHLMLSFENVHVMILLGKYTLVLLGLAALFGWTWSPRLRRASTLIGSGVMGVALLIGASLVGYYWC